MMSVDIRLPNINSTTDAGQIAQIRSYLYQFAEQMQWALNTIESGNTTSVDITATKKTGGAAESDDFESNFNSVKSLIMKSAPYTSGIGKVYELPNGSDVNDLTEIGVYCIPSNSSAETMTNLPVSMAGRIVVSSSNGSGKYNGTWAYLLQEYTTFDGYYRFYRMIHTAGTADEWIYNNWWCHSSTHWQDLGLSSNVTAAGTSMGRTPYGCSYRVVDENHVYVAFNCSFEYTVDGGSIIVNSTSIPEKYRPTRNVYAFCATGGRYVSRIYVNTSGNVAIEWVQFLYDTSATESHSGTWIDGYIDYWV